MAENSGFFASVGGDRKYNMDFLARWIASIIGNGVYDGELAVTAGGGMTVTLPAGRAWINGYHYRNDGPLTLPVDNADGVLHRKDTVVLRWDVNARSITARVLKGAPASSPIAPAIVRSAEQYDLKIAEISIPAGTTAITQSLITDTRLDNDVCGIVTGVVQQVDTTTFYNQIKDDLARFRETNEADFTGWSAEQKAAFDAWLQTMKDIPPDDAAAYLQNQIDAHVNNADIHVTPSQKSAIDTAVQSVSFGDVSCSKNGTDVAIPFAPFDDTFETVPYIDGANMGFLRTGCFYCPDVLSHNPFGGSTVFEMISIAQHHEGMVRMYRQIAFSYDGDIKQRLVDSNNASDGWFPQNDDGTGLKHYTKYADGRLHEWGVQVGAITATSAYGNMYLYGHYNINLLNHCVSNVSAHVNIYSAGALVGEGATLKNGTDNVLEFNVLSPISVSNLAATFMYDLWSRWK